MTPDEILQAAYASVQRALNAPFIDNTDILNRVMIVSRRTPRAAVRVLLACLLAKIHRPEVDIRKPYTEIGGADAFSGRTYDETYIARFILDYGLPVTQTTGFLTPAYRTKNIILTPQINLGGRKAGNVVYTAMLHLLDDVYTERADAEMLLREIIRQLILVRDEQQQRLQALLAGVESVRTEHGLSAEEIVTLIQQHIAIPGTSRLPVLVVVAAYQVAETYLGERVLPLEAHNAADRQTGALGDLQIALIAEDSLVTAYEMKTRRITVDDLDLVIQKLADSRAHIDNYIFITTDTITEQVHDYARHSYDRIGIEIVVLDCIGFLRHFLHLFHRLRMDFLDAYQRLLVAEPESAVRQPLKEAFLALRQAAESHHDESE